MRERELVAFGRRWVWWKGRTIALAAEWWPAVGVLRLQLWRHVLEVVPIDTTEEDGA